MVPFILELRINNSLHTSVKKILLNFNRKGRNDQRVEVEENFNDVLSADICTKVRGQRTSRTD